MKNNFILLIMALICINTFGQSIEIDEISVSRIALRIDKSHEEGETEGPIVQYSVKFYNNSDSVLRIYPSRSYFIQSFKCNDKQFSISVSSFGLINFNETEYIDIFKDKPYTLVFSVPILWRTDLLKEQPSNYDYSKEIIQILPTIRLLYVDKCNRFQSRGIGNVKISSYTYTPKLNR